MGESYEERYTEVEIVGAGSYGRVHAGVAMLVESVPEKRKLVAKKIKLGSLKEKKRQTVLDEVKILKTLRHFNIVSYEESLLTDTQLVIIMEYCASGDLARVLQGYKDRNERIPEQQVLSWFAQMSLALNYLHGKHILHRDIKPSNVYLTAEGTIRLGDFGIAKVLESTADLAHSFTGTFNYMSPEAMESQPYSMKSDVWALGCVLYEMCTLRPAFPEVGLIALAKAVANEEVAPIPDIYSPAVWKLIQ